jgi:YfiH family protein
VAAGGAPPAGLHGGTPGEAPRVWSGHRAAGAARIGRYLATDRAVGDLSIDGEAGTLAARRRRVLDRPWVWVRQVHGAEVLVVGPDDEPGAVSGREADAVVTRRDDIALAVHAADCAPVALVGRDGSSSSSGAVVGAVHAGWKGLEAGVLPAAVATMRSLGAVEVEAALGPCIGPECYEFGLDDLDALAARFGPAVRGETSEGRPALDLRAGVSAALAEVGVVVVDADGRCTACAGREQPALFSHRARGEVGRQALVVWLEAPR